MTKQRLDVVLIGILLAGSFLRFHDLGRQSFWLDEAYTWGVAVNTTWQSVWSALLVVSDVSPLPYLIAKLAVPLFGAAEFGLRLPSAFFGWLAIPVTYRLGRAMLGREAGILASVFIAFSPFAVWYSQDARPYGLYLFFGALAFWGFYRAGQGRGWGMFILASAALYVTHYLAALFVYAQAFYLLTGQHPRLLLRRWLLAQGVAVIPVAAWVIAFLAQRRLLTANTWIPPVTLLTPAQTIWNFISGDALRPSVTMAAGLLLGIGLMALGAVKYWRSRPAAIQLLLWWLGLPLLATWLFSLRLPAYIDRFFEPAILTVALLMAAGISALPAPWRRIASGLLALGLLGASLRLFMDPVYAKEDWRGLTQALQAKGLVVGVMDAESLLGVTPYVSPGVRFEFARTKAELSQRLADGKFVMIWRSPYESAHALAEAQPYHPLANIPPLVQEWLAETPATPIEVQEFTGLALVTIGK